jgi:hypothetical protein
MKVQNWRAKWIEQSANLEDLTQLAQREMLETIPIQLEQIRVSGQMIIFFSLYTIVN